MQWKTEILKQLNDIFVEKKYDTTFADSQYDSAFDEAYEISDGYLGSAIDVVCNKEYRENYKFAQNFIRNCQKSTDVINFVGYFNKNNFEEIIYLFSKIYRSMLIANLTNTQNSVYSNAALVKIIKLLNEYKKMYESNVSISALCENLLLKIMEIKNLCK